MLSFVQLLVFSTTFGTDQLLTVMMKYVRKLFWSISKSWHVSLNAATK